jgi:hypothetical protein
VRRGRNLQDRSEAIACFDAHLVGLLDVCVQTLAPRGNV